MSYVFGPVPSRRLGLSLGIDLIPSKTCTYNCLYCQVGKTDRLTMEPEPFIPVEEAIKALDKTLDSINPDTITLAGSGEPTLNSEIDQVISFIKKRSDTQVALLTNGSLLWNEEVVDRVSGADLIMPTLSTVFDETFKTIHRPHRGLFLPVIIKGLTELKNRYKGRILLEVVLLAGINDSKKELEGLRNVIDDISPDKIQLNTVVRPPSDHRAISLNMERLESIKDFFGEKAEIIAHKVPGKNAGRNDSHAEAIIEMAKRRPITAGDVEDVLNITSLETESILKGLVIKGLIKKKEHEKEVFYRV
jgi:wyosine [tRNA(Phe)-imidazoG37] synthetase (radical SAM superfamily)